MLIKVNFTPNTEGVPIETSVDILKSYIMKCLGKNNKYHDTFSYYNNSSLQGGKLIGNDLWFHNGMHIIISWSNFHNEYGNDIIEGINNNPNFGFGMTLQSITPLNRTIEREYDYVRTISPILLRSNKERITFKNDLFIPLLTKQCIEKVRKEDESINLKGFEIKLMNYTKIQNKVKDIKVSNSMNDCSMVMLKISGSKKLRNLLYDMGLGNSTGIGFGTVKTNKNDW